MNKKSKKAPPHPGDFRNSDFMGADPTMQARLSASLNTLSHQLATAREVLAAAGPATLANGSHVPAEDSQPPAALVPMERRGPGETTG